MCIRNLGRGVDQHGLCYPELRRPAPPPAAPHAMSNQWTWPVRYGPASTPPVVLNAARCRATGPIRNDLDDLGHHPDLQAPATEALGRRCDDQGIHQGVDHAPARGW
jgi:hypothetical protein